MKKDLVRIIPQDTLKRRKRINLASYSTFYRTSRNILALVFVFFMISTLSFLLTKNLKESKAYDISKFNAGNIISDYTMSNVGTMTEAQIQEFLTSKNPCNDRNIQRAANFPGYKYHIEMVNLSVFLKRPLNTMVKNKLPLGLFLRQVEIFKLTHKF